MQYDRQTRLRYAQTEESPGSRFAPPSLLKSGVQFSPQPTTTLGGVYVTTRPATGYVPEKPMSPGATVKGHPTSPSVLSQGRARIEALKGTMNQTAESIAMKPVNTANLAFKTTSQLRDQSSASWSPPPARGARVAGKRTSRFTDDLSNNFDNRPLVKDNGFTSSGNRRMYSQNCMRTHSEKQKAGKDPQPWRSMKSGPYALTTRG
jgi:hypothetical protein